MGKLTLQPKIPPAPPWWESLALILGFSQRQSRIFWSALSRSTAPTVVALRYQCYAHEAYLQTQRLDLLRDSTRLDTFLRQTWCPRQMIGSLEHLYREGLLSRQECSHFEDKFLVRCNREGHWTIPTKGI